MDRGKYLLKNEDRVKFRISLKKRPENAMLLRQRSPETVSTVLSKRYRGMNLKSGGKDAIIIHCRFSPARVNKQL